VKKITDTTNKDRRATTRNPPITMLSAANACESADRMNSRN